MGSFYLLFSVLAGLVLFLSSCPLCAHPSTFRDFCLPVSLNLHSRIGRNVGILMLLPRNDVRMLQTQSHGLQLGLVPDSEAVSLSFSFPRQWVGNCLFAASFHELLTSRPKRGSCPSTHWESTFSSRPTAGDKNLGFQNRPNGVLWLQTCQVLFQFHF